ncbi:PAS domain-containing protein, partial [bacterium]|nr:PAS domain-containing protein [bacterium]
MENSDQLRELEQKCRILVENMAQGVCVLNKKMEITFINDRLCKAWGYSRDELLGKEVCSFFEVPNKQIIRREFRERSKGKSSTYTLAGKTKGGKEIVFSVSGVPFLDGEGK